MDKIFPKGVIAVFLILAACSPMSYTTQRPSNQLLREAQGKKILQLTEALLKTTNPAGAGRVPTIIVQNPSARLTGSVQIFFEPDTVQEEDITGYGAGGAAFGYFGSAWDLWAAVPGLNRRENILNRVESAQALPRSYEWDSAVKLIKVTATLATPQIAGPVSVAGTWYVRVYWEPNLDFTGDDRELLDLFSQCQFSVQ